MKIKGLIFIFCLMINATIQANKISLFPLENYNQTISYWINPTLPNYNSALLDKSVQDKHFSLFISHYFGNFSPWNENYITTILTQSEPDTLYSLQKYLITYFSNDNKSEQSIGFGENFRPYSQEWINNIADNINFQQLENPSYNPDNRAIATENLLARILPTEDVHFYNPNLAGQGYPFDNLQMSSVWAGTPLYVFSQTKNRKWSLVVTPDFVAWVKTKGIAYTSSSFINSWQTYAHKKLAAITKTKTPIIDLKGHYQFSGYVGAVFPLVDQSDNFLTIMVPLKDPHQKAVLSFARVEKQHATLMPMKPSPKNFTIVMESLLGRPYGWGNMYLYNDCSAELKSLYTPFGIWLPRHSSHQITVGKMVDMSYANEQERIQYLTQNGHPFFTIVYIGGHVFNYLGNFNDPSHKIPNRFILTYQNIWGLRPNASLPDSRTVIGQSVLFPLLTEYPEDQNLVSLANKKYFQIAYLDELPIDINEDYMSKKAIHNLRGMILPSFNLNNL